MEVLQYGVHQRFKKCKRHLKVRLLTTGQLHTGHPRKVCKQAQRGKTFVLSQECGRLRRQHGSLCAFCKAYMSIYGAKEWINRVKGPNDYLQVEGQRDTLLAESAEFPSQIFYKELKDYYCIIRKCPQTRTEKLNLTYCLQVYLNLKNVPSNLLWCPKSFLQRAPYDTSTKRETIKRIATIKITYFTWKAHRGLCRHL